MGFLKVMWNMFMILLVVFALYVFFLFFIVTPWGTTIVVLFVIGIVILYVLTKADDKRFGV